MPESVVFTEDQEHEEVRVFWSHGASSGVNTGFSVGGIVATVRHVTRGDINVDRVEKRVIRTQKTDWVEVPKNG